MTALVVHHAPTVSVAVDVAPPPYRAADDAIVEPPSPRPRRPRPVRVLDLARRAPRIATAAVRVVTAPDPWVRRLRTGVLARAIRGQA